MAASTFPRAPTTAEKTQIAAIAFPATPVGALNFTGVWMLAPLNNDLDFNCFAWSILALTTISIPDKLDTLEYLAGRAKEKYGGPCDYVPTSLGAADAAIVAWGSATNNIMHASRICTKSLLEDYAGEFHLSFDFSSAAASGFPSGPIWTSKFGDRQAFITHPRNWLSGSVWGTAQGDLKIKK